MILESKEAVEVSALDNKLYPFEGGAKFWENFGQEEDKPLVTSLTYVLKPEESTNYIFHVYGESMKGQIYGGYSFAMTNPLYVDVP